MAVGKEEDGTIVRHDQTCGSASVITRSIPPPPLPEAGDVPASTLRSLAAVVNRTTDGPGWVVVGTGPDGPAAGNGPPSGNAPANRGAAWRELVDRSGSRRIEVLVDGIPVLVFTPGAGRVTTGLVMPGTDRIVDISVQPGSAVGVLEQLSHDGTDPPAPDGTAGDTVGELGGTPGDASVTGEAGGRRGSIDRVVRGAIDVAVERADAWRPPAMFPLIGVFGGCAFPLLASAYELGAEPLGSIPRWAEPIVSAKTIGLGAGIAFGRSATRPVRRALVEALRPGTDGRVDLAVLALALIGRDVLQPDRIARLLAAERVPHPVADLPDPYTLEAAAAVVGDWGDQRCERILVDAAGRPDGLRTLLATTAYAVRLGADGPQGRLPSRLAELHDVYRVLMRSAPSRGDADTSHLTDGNATDRAAGRITQRADRTDPPTFPHPVLPARRGSGHVDAAASRHHLDLGTRIDHRPAIRRLDGLQVGDLRFVLPHTVADLRRWGRLLSNCLGDFSAEVVSGRVSLIGVDRNRRLAYAIEVTARGEIRQFNGPANRTPHERDRLPVITALVEAGAVDPGRGNNRAWIDGAGRSEAHGPTPMCESSCHEQ